VMALAVITIGDGKEVTDVVVGSARRYGDLPWRRACSASFGRPHGTNRPADCASMRTSLALTEAR
jgi:hypothetical protein